MKLAPLCFPIIFVSKFKEQMRSFGQDKFLLIVQHHLILVAYNSAALLVTLFFHLCLFPPFISNVLKFCPSYNKYVAVLVILVSSCDV